MADDRKSSCSAAAEATLKLTLHHINVTGANVPGLDAFYADVLMQGPVPEMAALPTLDENALRAPVAFRSDGQVQFHLAEQDLGLGLRHAKGINPLERGHIAFRTGDIAAFKRHLEERGIPYADYGTTFTRFWHQIFFHDPADTIIEVHQVLEAPGDARPSSDGTGKEADDRTDGGKQ